MHLTVGQQQAPDRLVLAEKEVAPRLPVVGEVLLLVHDGPGGRWRTAERFPLSRR